MSVEGIRVIRGPDWSDGDDDGGEGHVGTVTLNNANDTVDVQWDMGNSGTYRTGKDGKCTLRILDSAPAGMKHGGVSCGSCDKSNFPGTRWKCQSCPQVNLCSPCYFADSHDIQHAFLRIDAPGFKGQAVPKRSISTNMRALGIYVGSKVKRGVDWTYGDQDGGDRTIGSVTEMDTWGSSGPERDAVKVKWPNKRVDSYRVGYRGKVDLVCVEQMPGMHFYRDHLFPMNTHPIPKASSMQMATLTREKSVIGFPKIQIGENVCVELPEMALKEAQRGHGGWSMRMKEYIGKRGTVKRFEENGDCIISYDDKEWRFNVDAVRKIPSVKIGDIVRIMENSDKVQALQKRHGGWQAEMKSALGQVGKVVKIDSDGDVAVAFGNKAWVFNPACCIPAPGGKVEALGSGGGAGGDSVGGSSAQNSDSDSDTGDASEVLGHLIAQMLLLGGQQNMVGPQNLVSAAAQDNSAMVQRILKDHPQLIDKPHQELTALIISSHEGHMSVVKVLLKAGANKDLTEPKGNTALMAALMKKREEIAVLLIQAGANINMVNKMNRTALHFAAANECNTALKELLRRGTELNKQDDFGDTPIHDAIHNKNSSAVAFLLAQSKINLKLGNKKGHSPLHLAAMKDDAQSVSRIITKAPELINAGKVDDGFTALHVAAINDNTDVIKTLLKAKAQVNVTNNDNTTPLHLATHQGYLASTQLLVQASANVNAKDNDGDTPLHNCVMGRRSGGGQELLARLLLGISTPQDGNMKERINVACYLIAQGTDVRIKNKKGRTPLECCSDEKMRNAIRLFAEKHGGGASGGGRSQRTTVGGLLAQLFTDLSIPCMGCMEEMSDTKLEPCGHKVMCKQCSFKVRECPMCDTAIQERYDLDGHRLVIADSCTVQ